ncbi:MAG: cytochrome c [Holophagales bacterium]|nr:cytochrome c [Holophagales bacterium]
MTFLPEMVDSGVVHAYDRNPMRESVPSLFLPPAGTVPVEWLPFEYGSGPEEARRAGVELRNPFVAGPESLARGKQVYDTVCTVCHGPKGEGDGPIIGRFPNPPSLLAPHAQGLPDGQIVHVITRGQGIMPSHAAQVLLEDRWKAVLYVRQLQGVPAVPPEVAP